MSDIQTRLAEINDRLTKSKADRDRQYFAIIGYHVLIIAAAIVFYAAMNRADEVFHQQDLAQQESHNG